MSVSVLIVDDEPGLRKMLSIALKQAGYRAETASNAERALEILEETSFDLLVSDLKMPGISGLDLLRKVKQQTPVTEVIIMTAHGSIDSAMDAVRAGAFDYIEKPFSMAEMELTVLRAHEQAQLKRENLSMRKELDKASFLGQLVGVSPPMREVFDLVRRAAPSRASVLITGESGTGKELIAKALHTLSKRANSPFLAVNCGAIPEPLLESELFGHRRGAFTGAERDRPGLFQAANSGSLLLDEIGEMPLSLQVKLLRVLQEKRVKPVGGHQELPVDVRIIASTNRNLLEEVKLNTFREDLFYRLNVIHIGIPPLRERREDILPLAHHLLAQLAKEAALVVPTLSEEARQFLSSYDYPGNARELENMLERALVLHQNGTISLGDIWQQSGSSDPAPSDLSLDEKMARHEREYIMESLTKTGWNRTESAKLLGISFRSLRYRMAKLGLAER